MYLGELGKEPCRGAPRGIQAGDLVWGGMGVGSENRPPFRKVEPRRGCPSLNRDQKAPGPGPGAGLSSFLPCGEIWVEALTCKLVINWGAPWRPKRALTKQALSEARAQGSTGTEAAEVQDRKAQSLGVPLRMPAGVWGELRATVDCSLL